jgi:hypothetical protein
MKTTRTAAAALAVLMCGILAAGSAFAHGPRTRVGIYVGAPFVGFGYYGYYGYYPPPYYYPSYYPAPVVVQQQPTVYVEQPAAQPQQQQQPAGYWYYCADSRAYYPYVKECPAGWQRVAPQPG